MKNNVSHHRAPEARSETLRQELIAMLKESRHTVGSLSQAVRKQQAEVLEHLVHMQKAEQLVIEPAECLKCGYVFNDRKRIKKPSKCPKCKGTYIEEPLYVISG